MCASTPSSPSLFPLSSSSALFLPSWRLEFWSDSHSWEKNTCQDKDPKICNWNHFDTFKQFKVNFNLWEIIHFKKLRWKYNIKIHNKLHNIIMFEWVIALSILQLIFLITAWLGLKKLVSNHTPECAFPYTRRPGETPLSSSAQGRHGDPEIKGKTLLQSKEVQWILVVQMHIVWKDPGFPCKVFFLSLRILARVGRYSYNATHLGYNYFCINFFFQWAEMSGKL